jgi:hypothetical protein
MESRVVEIISHISSLSIIAPLLCYLLKFRIASRPVHIIGALVIVSALCDLTGFILMSGKHSTATVFNIYYLSTFILLSWYYYESIFNARHKNVLPVGSMVFLALFLLITLTMQDISHYQNMVWVLISVILMAYALVFGAYLHTNLPYTSEQGESAICFNCGIFFYFTWSITIFILSEYLFEKLDPETTLAVWGAHNMGNIGKNMFLTVGFYLTKNRN